MLQVCCWRPACQAASPGSATSEIVELTECLATAASARNERLHDTDLAAEILILPESTGSRPRGHVLLSGNS